MRKVNLEVFVNWSKGREVPRVELAYRAGISVETVNKVFRGMCPATQKVRVKICSTIGVDEDVLFPLIAA
jgi:transcriptional regulator with XRE-family HTH domain